MRWAPATPHLDKCFFFFFLLRVCEALVFHPSTSSSTRNVPRKTEDIVTSKLEKERKKSLKRLWKRTYESFGIPHLMRETPGRAQKSSKRVINRKRKKKPKNRKHPQLTDIEKILGGAVKGKKVKPEILKPASISRSQQFLRWGWISRRTRK